jgi:uncharacterized HAD superfamily protein
VTARPDSVGPTTTHEVTSMWLRAHLNADHPLIISEDKGATCRNLGIDLIIDDRLDNLLSLPDTTQGVLLLQPWNASDSVPERVAVAGDLHHAVEMVEALVQKGDR